MDGKVIAVSSSAAHTFSKHKQDRIGLIAGLGVDGDAHMGTTVKHRSRVAQDPTQPNLRQVHLLHSELFDKLQLVGFRVAPGQMGENITTRGIALLDLPTGTRLSIGDTAVIEVTGLRNPCVQIDQFQAGLLSQVVHCDANGTVVRKAGIMSIVLATVPLPPVTAFELNCPHHPIDRLTVCEQ